VFVAHGPPGEGRAVIYLHGRCGDPLAFRAWARAAARVATVVSIQGDVKCKGGFRTTWSNDVRALDRRVTQALAAVGAARGAPLDGDSLTVVGYSLGASRAEDLVSARPRRYRRALLVAGPLAPEPASFAEAGAVAVIAGGRDRRRHLEEGASALADGGVAARYMLLPGAKHGEYGPEGERVMGEALAWALHQAP
jgi:predicted esterase